MKLNKTELTALASRIRNNINAAAEADQKMLNKKSDAANKDIAEDIKKSLIGLSKKTKEYLASQLGYNDTFTNTINVENILRKLRKTKTKIVVPGNYYNMPSEIFDDLVIAQIDSENLEDLIKKVTKKYISV